MKRFLLSTVAAVAMFPAVAFAQSTCTPSAGNCGHIVTHYQVLSGAVPYAVRFVTDVDGGMDSSGNLTGTVYCTTLLPYASDAMSPVAFAIISMFDKSSLFGYVLDSNGNPTTAPVKPIFFQTGTASAQSAGTTGYNAAGAAVVTGAECGIGAGSSDTFAFKFRQ